MGIFSLLVVFALGLLLWPLVEYAIHGLLSHRWRTPVSPFHWDHHVHPRRVFTSPLAWVPALVLVSAGLGWTLGASYALVGTAGLFAGFVHYEYVHWRIHYRLPTNEREQRLRDHHLAHHFRNAKAYFGVSNRLCDRLFGSLPKSWPEDYAAVRDVPPIEGPSNLGSLVPRRRG